MTEPKVTRRKITDYQPDPSNANLSSERGHREIDNSVSEDGAHRSGVADKNGVIVAGNQTLQAMVENGIEDVIEVETTGNEWVIVKRVDADVNDPNPNNLARRIAYRDNRTQQLSLTWNPEQLLRDMQSGFDMEKLFNQDELDALLSELQQQEAPADDPGAQVDRAGELQAKWQVARGQVWRIGKHRLMCGDSTSAEDVARLMGGECVKLVITDPPYGVEYSDKNKFLNAIAPSNRIQTPIEGDYGSKDDIQAMWKSAFKNMSDVMHPGAVVYCFMPQGGDQMMMMMMMMGAGIEPRHELIWLKNNHVLGRVDYAYKHEPILYAWKEGGHKFYGDFQTSILEFDKPLKSDLHPTTKPVELVLKLMENSSQRAEAVYDPFCGSGTTLVACEQAGRIGYGMEIAPEYCSVILQRLADMGLTPELDT